MKIAILDDYQDTVSTLDCFKLLAGHDVLVLTETFTDPKVLAAKLGDVEALVLIRERTHITEALLSMLPQLKLISQTGRISHHIDLSACQRYGVSVVEGIGSPVAPAELCWALMLAANRNLPAYCANLSAGEWQHSGSLGLGRTLSGLTLGIWGYGKIGQRIAQYGKAFSMRVFVWGSEASRMKATEHGFYRRRKQSGILQRSRCGFSSFALE